MNIETKKSFIINVLFYLIIIGMVVLGCKFVLPFLVPFLIGFCIAFILKKPIRFAHDKIHLKYSASAVFFVTLFYLIVGGLLTLIGFGIVSGMQSFFAELPTLYESYAKEVITTIIEKVENIIMQINQNEELIAQLKTLEGQLLGAVGSIVSKVSTSLVGGVGSFATSIPGFFIKLVLMIISSFFIAIDYDLIMNFMKKQIGDKASGLIKEIKEYLFGTVFVCIKSYAIIMSITFVELAILLTVIGVKNSIIIALGIALFDILPVFGTGGVMIPWGIVTLILGDIKMGILLLAVYLVVTVVRNIIEPRIVGGELGLHPLVTLVSMFVGVNLAGVIGLFGFPIVLSLLLHLNKKDTIKILRK